MVDSAGYTNLQALFYSFGTLGIHFGSHQKRFEKFGYVRLGESEIFWQKVEKG